MQKFFPFGLCTFFSAQMDQHLNIKDFGKLMLMPNALRLFRHEHREDKAAAMIFEGTALTHTSSRLLDVGCGPCGPLVFAVKSTGCMGTGLDVSASAIGSGRARASVAGVQDRVALLEADLNLPIPFDGSSFDAAISLDVAGLAGQLLAAAFPRRHAQDIVSRGHRPDRFRRISRGCSHRRKRAAGRSDLEHDDQSQFSREYKRHFGVPPIRDIRGLREVAA
jgi:SAM-dependent methyltransferase